MSVNRVSTGSGNCWSPIRHQAIIWTNAGLLTIRPLGTNFHEILIKIRTFSLKKMHFKMSSAKSQPFCLGLNVWIEHFRQFVQEAHTLDCVSCLLWVYCHWGRTTFVNEIWTLLIWFDKKAAISPPASVSFPPSLIILSPAQLPTLIRSYVPILLDNLPLPPGLSHQTRTATQPEASLTSLRRWRGKWVHFTNFFTHCGLVMPYGNRTGSTLAQVTALLPDGTMPLPEPKLTSH